MIYPFPKSIGEVTEEEEEDYTNQGNGNTGKKDSRMSIQ